jgi:tRNA (adenine57-N1/adenine58-N1)-methyltransferase
MSTHERDEDVVLEDAPPAKKQKTVHTESESADVVVRENMLTFVNGSYGQGNGTIDNTIKAGDMIMIFIEDDDIRPTVVVPSQRFDCKAGSFIHATFVGREFGSKIFATPTKQQKPFQARTFIYLLRPTPLLWTLALRHRTQILYHVDIGFIASMLHLKPGSRVIEAGTGSGSLSHTIARIIHNSDFGEAKNSRRRGHLFTFEYHEKRYKEAEQEFRRHGFNEGMITITHGDVCENGFKNKEETEEDMHGTIDAIFLDLPKPWVCIPNVKQMLRVGGRFCGFSPCIEQIQRTADALRQHDFTEIRTFEVLNRVYREEKVVLEKPAWEVIERPVPEPKPISTEEESEKELTKQQRNQGKKKKNRKGEEYPMFMSPRDMRGHTGYLIFASKFNQGEQTL